MVKSELYISSTPHPLIVWEISGFQFGDLTVALNLY